jgi:WD40 repeat protein
MADLFVSYAREDQAAVRLLHTELAARGREAWVDWEGIEPSDQWLRTIMEAIDAADAIVVVLSPDWLESEVCRAEADRAIAENKRLIPVVARDIEQQRDRVPQALAELNWIFARPGLDEIGEAADAVLRALDTNLGLVRTHTLVLTRARAWELGGRRSSPLLRGDELRQGEEWMSQAAAGVKPQPTELQAAFVAASRSAARHRARTTVTVSLTVAALSVALAAFALVSRSQAVQQSHIAFARELTADSTAALNSDPELSLLLAQEALKRNPNAAARLAFVTAMDNTTIREILHWGGKGASAIGADYSPNSNLAAIGGQDGSIALWDPATGQVRTLKADDRAVDAVTFSPNGQLLASGGNDKLINIWEVSSGKRVQVLRGHRNLIDALDFSRDGRFLISSSYDGTVRVWVLATGKSIVLKDPGMVTGVGFTPNSGDVVAANESNGTTLVWSTQTWKIVAGTQAVDVSEAPSAIAVSPSGRLVAIGQTDGAVRLWRWQSEPQPVTIGLEHDGILDVAFSRDGKLLASGGINGSAEVWDVSGRRLLQTFVGDRGIVDGISFSPDGRSLVTAGGDGTARLWKVTTDIGAVIRVLRPKLRVPALVAGAISPTGDIVVAAAPDGVIHAWHLLRGGQIWQTVVDKTDGGPNALSFGDDGKRIVAAASSGVKIIDPADGSIVASRAGPQSISAALSPDGMRVAAGGNDHRVRIWALKGKSAPVTVPLLRREGDPSALAFSPDGQVLAVALTEDHVLLLNGTTGKRMGELDGPTDSVLGIAFSADGTLLAGASADKRAWLWNVKSGEVIRVFVGHTGPVSSVAISPNGELLATASDDETARVWDLQTGDEVRLLSGDTDQVTWVGFSADSRAVVTTSADTTVRVWDSCLWCGSASQLEVRARPEIVRCLTAEERQTFLHEPAGTDEACAA